jgi:DNA-directed RNA polymerase alpha subunit
MANFVELEHIDEGETLRTVYKLGPYKSGQFTLIYPPLVWAIRSCVGLAVIGIRVEVDGKPLGFDDSSCVKEDLLDILLNVKQISLEGTLEHPFVVRHAVAVGRDRKVEDEFSVETGGFTWPGSISVLNPEQSILTIIGTGVVEVQLIVGRGLGYVLDSALSYMIPEDFFPVDGVFTPIRDVNESVFTYSVERELMFDSEFPLEDSQLTISTDGRVVPESALRDALGDLQCIFGTLLDIVEEGIPGDPEQKGPSLLFNTIK